MGFINTNDFLVDTQYINMIKQKEDDTYVWYKFESTVMLKNIFFTTRMAEN